MRRSPLPIVVVVVGLALAACAYRAQRGANVPSRVRVLPLNPAPRTLPSRDPMSVEVFTTSRPLRPYIEISSFTAGSGVGDEDITDMRYEAGSLGCDALVMTVISTSFDMRSTGTCVVWNDPPAPPPQTPVAPAAPAAPTAPAPPSP
jgi:hypothetical protein